MRIFLSPGRVSLFWCLLLLAGCGGGANDANNGGSDADAAVDAPLADDPQQETPPSVANNPDHDSIENLFGHVTFAFRVNGSNNEAEISVVFSASDEGDLVLGGRTVRALTDQQVLYECVEIRFTTEDFLCVRVSIFQNTNEVFYFSMDSQLVGSGAYEFCDGTPEACGNEVVVSPDGTVDVTISRNTAASGSSAYLNGVPTSNSELMDFMHADALEFGAGNAGSTLLPKSRELEKTLESVMGSLR